MSVFAPGASLALAHIVPARAGSPGRALAAAEKVFAELLAPAGPPLELAPARAHLPLPGDAGGALGDDAAVTADPSEPEVADWLHPAARQVAHLAPPPALVPAAPPLPMPTVAASSTAPPVSPGTSGSLEEILPALVRRIAWSGDSRKGSVRIELGAGALSGATLLVHADGGRVRVALHAPGAIEDLESWRARIEARLAAKGLDVTGVEVQR